MLKSFIYLTLFVVLAESSILISVISKGGGAHAGEEVVLELLFSTCHSLHGSNGKPIAQITFSPLAVPGTVLQTGNNKAKNKYFAVFTGSSAFCKNQPFFLLPVTDTLILHGGNLKA